MTQVRINGAKVVKAHSKYKYKYKYNYNYKYKHKFRYGYGTKVDGPHGSSTVYVHGFGTDDSYHQPAPAHG